MADVFTDGSSKKKILWSGSVVLPAPVSLSVNDELIWTSDTGRTLSGRMVGDVIAENAYTVIPSKMINLIPKVMYKIIKE